MAGRQERLPGPGAIGNGNLNGTGSGMPLHPQLGNMAGISGMDLTGQAQGQHLPRMAVPMASNDPRLFASTTSLGYGSPGYSLDDEQQMQTPTTQQEDERPVKKKRKERIKLACDNCEFAACPREGPGKGPWKSLLTSHLINHPLLRARQQIKTFLRWAITLQSVCSRGQAVYL